MAIIKRYYSRIVIIIINLVMNNSEGVSVAVRSFIGFCVVLIEILM